MNTYQQPRFSKSAYQTLLRCYKSRYEKQYGFTDQNGWAQVEGKGEAINREYGAYDLLCQLIDNLDA